MPSYDLIVIGTGPAGQRAAIQGAKMGKRVAVIERREVLGGVCVNTGTIPSKTFREAVVYLSGHYYQNGYGSNSRAEEKITIAELAERVRHVVHTEVDVIRDQLARNRIELINGTAGFVDEHTLRVTGAHGDQTCTAEKIIIATGTRPAYCSEVPMNGRNILDSDQLLGMLQIPATLIVVGGGVIGVEYTCMFATLGVRVTMVEKRSRLLEFADAEMVEALTYHLRDHRVTLRLNEEVQSVEEMPDGSVVANLQSKKKTGATRCCTQWGVRGMWTN